MIRESLTKLKSISIIKLPEIIQQETKDNIGSLNRNLDEEIDKALFELNSVYKYAVCSPLAFLAIIRQYEYLIKYKEYGYLEVLDILILHEKYECLKNEYKLIKQDEFDIEMKFQNEINCGFFLVDITKLKKELVHKASSLSNYIAQSNLLSIFKIIFFRN